VLGFAAGDHNPAALPFGDLMKMELPVLLAVIESLAKFHEFARRRKSTKDQRQVIWAASRVLEDWPRGFIGLLHESTNKHHLRCVDEIQKHVQGAHKALFSDLATGSRRQLEFLEVIFVEFAWKEWRYADPEHHLRYQDRLPTGYLTQTPHLFSTRDIVGSTKRIQDEDRCNSPESNQAPPPRIRSRETSSNVSETQKVLGCKGLTIEALFHSGVLRGAVGPKGLRIEHESIEEFKRKYTFIAEVARAENVTSPELIKLCTMTGIYLNWPDSRSKPGN
jgi:hypothetical protein